MSSFEPNHKLKPLIAKKLQALGLNEEVIEAFGNKVKIKTFNPPSKSQKVSYQCKKEDHQWVADFIGGYGANLLGHNHPELKKVVLEHLNSNSVNLAQLTYRKPAQELSEKLCAKFKHTFSEDAFCFLGNTGAEAVEIALKQCILASSKKTQAYGELPLTNSFNFSEDAEDLLLQIFKTSEVTISQITSFNIEQIHSRPWLALEGSYHGKSLLALGVTSNQLFRQPFSSHLDPVHFIDINRCETSWTKPIFKIERKGEILSVDIEYISKYKAFIFEPLQGEAGIQELCEPRFRQILKSLKDSGTPIIADEIQSGLGRTGSFFYSDKFQITPDYILLGKSLAGGYGKISAVLSRSEIYNQEFDELHSSTFADDEISCKIASKVIDLIDGEEIARVCQEKGTILKAKLLELKEKYPQTIKSVRGNGLMLALEFFNQEKNTSSMIRYFNYHSVLGYLMSSLLLHRFQVRIAPTLSSPLSLRIEPSYQVMDSEISSLIEGLSYIAEALQKANFTALTAHLVGQSMDRIKDYDSYPRKLKLSPTKATKKVAFIAHMISIEDMAMVDPSLQELSAKNLNSLHKRSELLFGPALFDQFEVQSKTGEKTLFHFISLYERPQTMEKFMRERNTNYFIERIQEGVDLAHSLGCQTLGLGGFTSIISQNGHLVNSRGMSLTTGNSYTVSSTVEALLIAANKKSITPKESHLAIIGAPGNIGSLCTELAAEHFEKITLCGRPGSFKALKRLVYKILQLCQENPRWPLSRALATTASYRNILRQGLNKKDLDDFLESQNILNIFDHIPKLQCEVILTCTNSSDPILFSKDVTAATKVIIDTAIPYNVSEELKESRPDILIAQGGLISVPEDKRFYVSGIPTEYGSTLACLSETLICSLEGIKDHFSFGLLKKPKIKLIQELAEKHGFKVSHLKQDPMRYFYGADGDATSKSAIPSFSPSLTKIS